MTRVLMIVVAAVTMFCGTVFAGWDPAEETQARAAAERFLKQDPSLERFFNNAYGYVVFPEVFKGGLFFLGGGHGEGMVFEQGSNVGKSTVTLLNVGPQFGGQSFAEIIFFKGPQDLQRFRKGNFELSAQVSAVLVKSGIGTNSDYSDGVAVFVMPNAGVMAEASIGGQKFSFTPVR